MAAAGRDSQLERLQEGQVQVLVDLATVKGQLATLNGTVADIMAELGGAPPWETRGIRPTLRGALHELRTEVSPTAIEGAVVRAAERQRAQTWSTWQKWSALVSAVLAAVATLLRLAGVGG